jgi:hypothetical protein
LKDAGFDLADLADPALVPAPFKFGGKPCFDNHFGKFAAHDAAAKGNHVGIVVLLGKARCGRVAAEGAPYPRYLVGGKRNTRAGAADQNTAVADALRYSLRRFVTIDGIIARFRRIAAIVDNVKILCPSKRR